MDRKEEFCKQLSSRGKIQQIYLLIFREAVVRGWKGGLPIMLGRRGVELELQRFLFEMVGVEQLGLKLTEQNILIPLKLLSVIIGVGPDVIAG